MSFDHDGWIELRAVDDTKRISRSYQLDVRQDLFGHWIVTRRWGRIGKRGQMAIQSFDDRGKTERFIQKMITRRRSAKKRIGTPYLVHAATGCPLSVETALVTRST